MRGLRQAGPAGAARPCRALQGQGLLRDRLRQGQERQRRQGIRLGHLVGFGLKEAAASSGNGSDGSSKSESKGSDSKSSDSKGSGSKGSGGESSSRPRSPTARPPPPDALGSSCTGLLGEPAANVSPGVAATGADLPSTARITRRFSSPPISSLAPPTDVVVPPRRQCNVLLARIWRQPSASNWSAERSVVSGLPIVRPRSGGGRRCRARRARGRWPAGRAAAAGRG